MLYSEAVALHQNRAAISEQHYQRSVIAVREALDSVLAIEADDAQTRRLQSHYSQIGRNQLWSFLDSDVCFVSKPVGQNERVN